MTINNKSERNYRGKCLGWPVTSYGGERGLREEQAGIKTRLEGCGEIHTRGGRRR